ncbi:MAG: hypothetical protein LBH22_03415 [Bacteroidales bacterium]|jgi:hypothetical protein|nr:hypothetical protein [Bacteroidales bacterium]
MRTLKIILFLIFLQPLSVFAQQITHSASFKDIQLVNSIIDTNYLELSSEGLIVTGKQEGAPSLLSKSIFLYIPPGYQIESVAMVNPIIQTISLTKKILPGGADLQSVPRLTNPTNKLTLKYKPS